MTMARSCGLTAVAGHLAELLGRPENTLRQRLRELYQPAAVKRGAHRSELDPATCFPGLVRWAAAGAADRRLVIALDATTLADRLTVLCAAVVHRGCGLPVAWAVRPWATGPWNQAWAELLGRLRDALGEGWTVLVLSDRGLESAALFGAITALGWHPLMRAKAAGTFRPEGWHRGYPMGRFAAAGGGGGPGRGRRTGAGWPARCWRAGGRGTPSRGWC